MEGRIFRLSQLSEKTSLQTRYNSMLAGNASYIPVSGSYESLTSVTVPSGGLSQVVFGSIPQGYAHLQLSYFARTGNGTGLNLNINNDFTSTAYWHLLYGAGGGGSASSYTISTNYIQIGGMQSAANTFVTGVLDIVDSNSTVKNKTIRALSGWDSNSAGTIYYYSGQWINTAAITQLTISAQDGSSFVSGCTFSLYGAKG